MKILNSLINWLIRGTGVIAGFLMVCAMTLVVFMVLMISFGVIKNWLA